MMKRNGIALLIAAAGCAAPALAQDSVSSLGTGLPGDGLDPWDTNQQCVSYVVDLSPIVSSKGANFQMGPIIKTSKAGSAFFTSLTSAQAMSADMLLNVPYASASYDEWVAKGQGVHPTNNAAPGPPNVPAGMANQLACSVSEFATNDAAANVTNIITGIINWDAADPSKLFVTRIMSAHNSLGINSTANSASFGSGGVDADGNTMFRADDFGVVPGGVNGNNYFRVDALGRDCTALNQILGTGGSDSAATDHLVNNSGTTWNTPTTIPESIAGRPVGVGTNFNGNYGYEAAALAVFTEVATHRGTAPEHRGNSSFSPAVFFPGSIGTMGTLARSVVGALNNQLAVWGVDANGNVVGNQLVTLPILGLDDAKEPMVNGFSGPLDFNNDHGQVSFRGGNGHTGIGLDQSGNLIVAAQFTDSTGAFFGGDGRDDPCNGIAVARVASPGAGEAWSLAAWIDCDAALAVPNGKSICDDTGAAVGELALLAEVTGGAPLGPSLTCPSVDSVGNIWFLAAVQLYNGAGDDDTTGEGDDRFTTGLIRAIYSPATFTYNLELVLTNGMVVDGQNSANQYQLQFLAIANAGGSVSSGTFFSGNMTKGAANGVDPSTLSTGDAATMGGLVIAATIVYDVDKDTDFEDPTAGMGNPASVDESYNVLLFVGAGAPAAPPCPWDLNGDGVVGATDLAFLGGSWGNPGCMGMLPCPADFDGNGSVGSTDQAQLLGAWGPCP